MSELNIYHHELRPDEYAEFYLKYEADKVIAELEDDVTYWKKVAKKNMDDNVVMARQRAKAFKSERHQKYKRCLAVADKCAETAKKYYYLICLDRSNNPKYDRFPNKMDFWGRWRKRWLEFAEKFKEAK